MPYSQFSPSLELQGKVQQIDHDFFNDVFDKTIEIFSRGLDIAPEQETDPNGRK